MPPSSLRPAVLTALLCASCAASPPPPSASPNCPEQAKQPAPIATTTAAAESRAIPYDLPRAGEFAPPPALPSGVTHAQPMAAEFYVTITKDGTLSVNGKVVPADQIVRLAHEARAKDEAVRAVIRADRSASWGSVVQVMDLVKQGGIAKLAFAVSPLGQ